MISWVEPAFETPFLNFVMLYCKILISTVKLVSGLPFPVLWQRKIAPACYTRTVPCPALNCPRNRTCETCRPAPGTPCCPRLLQRHVLACNTPANVLPSRLPLYFLCTRECRLCTGLEAKPKCLQWPQRATISGLPIKVVRIVPLTTRQMSEVCTELALTPFCFRVLLLAGLFSLCSLTCKNGV